VPRLQEAGGAGQAEWQVVAVSNREPIVIETIAPPKCYPDWQLREALHVAEAIDAKRFLLLRPPDPPDPPEDRGQSET
jgi:hypothetical protein